MHFRVVRLLAELGSLVERCPAGSRLCSQSQRKLGDTFNLCASFVETGNICYMLR